MPVDAPPAVRWSQKARQVQQAHFRATANKLAASFDYLVATGQLFKPLETHWCVYADPARKANPPPPVTGAGDGHRQFRPGQDTFRQSSAAALPAAISIRRAGNRGGIAFRPGHHHGITPAGRPPQPLSQVAKFAASVFVGALISTLARDRTSAVTGLRALVERRCTFQNALSCSDRFEVMIRPA